LLPSPHCPQVTEFFVAGTEPTIIDNMYQEFRINRETGRLATIYTPPELVEARIYKIYPERAADYVREHEIEQPPNEFDTLLDESQLQGDVAIRQPGPFSFVREQVEIVGTARGDNFNHYRLAYFKGLSPSEIVTIADNVSEQQINNVLGVWDTGDLNGLYTVLLTVVQNDGSFQEASIHLTLDNTAPQAEIIFPLPNQQILLEDEWVIVQAQVTDDVSMDRVEFYVDNAGVPFAISTVPPFTERWRIPAPGCHSFKVIAFDAAGNETQSPAVSACAVGE
jgi:hypothetical protein